MPCKAAKEFLSHHRIAFTDRNIAEDPQALEELVNKTGRRATPVILMDDDVIVGFDRGKIERLLGL